MSRDPQMEMLYEVGSLAATKHDQVRRKAGHRRSRR